MSKFNECVELYKNQSQELGLGLDEALLTGVAKALGPSIYNADSSKVSGSDSKEIETVKNNFLIKKLGLDDSPALDSAISEVLEQLGSSNKNKQRAVVYALLAKKFGKESMFL
ncbi:MAG: DUF2853 family protein [Leadbetterella sp.]|jgi:hypothetical protein|uniref:DUF2853 family protein n=1 Tax=Lacihabitans sp. CCS-44 TaxID=2487331 RepID=UPI001B7789A0|nr:DUF2853 family protein [Lacihabitans sp. CCS-44]MBP6618815.1 DUF2853 family protein [Leadbetterella sp.]MBP8155880.1 DUF2853 family protein [Leadbetterella sp.]MCP9753638.1 DUF2853 family protein [Lacihabitans sp. CCS-44]